MNRKKLGFILEEKGLISQFQLIAALSHQRKWDIRLGESFVGLGHLEEKELYEVIAEQMGLELVNPLLMEISPDVLSKVDECFVRDWLALPVAFDGATWTIAAADPELPGFEEALKEFFGAQVKLALATPTSIARTKGISRPRLMGNNKFVKKSDLQECKKL